MVTTFETVMKEKHELQKHKFDLLILDEAQRIKNDESVNSEMFDILGVSITLSSSEEVPHFSSHLANRDPFVE